MKIIFAGTIGRSGLGGQAWASLQYLIGLRGLGHEVMYLEDCGRRNGPRNWSIRRPTFATAWRRLIFKAVGFIGRMKVRSACRWSNSSKFVRAPTS